MSSRKKLGPDKRMYRKEINGIVWRLEDETWSEAIDGLTLPVGDRRPHLILPHPRGPLFVKFFREHGIIPFLRNLFFPRGKKEYHAATKLLSLSLPTPHPVGYGMGRTFSCSAQVWVDGVDLFSRLKRDATRQASLTEVASLLKRMTVHKVRHDDFHGGNVLFGETGALIVDLHKVRIKHTFSVADEVSNLCHVLNGQYQHFSEREKSAFFEDYGKPEIRGQVEERLEVFARRWIERKKKRAFKTTSKLQSMGNIVHVKGREMLGAGGRTGLIKKDRKTVVERHSDHVRKIYSRAKRLRRAWENHVVLEYMEIPVVPRPFYVQKHSGRQKGFIAMEDLSRHGEEFDTFLDRTYDQLKYGPRVKLAKTLAHFCTSLLKAHVAHRDMKACNLFRLQDGSFRLIDVEDISFQGCSREALLRMCLQLNTSVPGRISVTDRIRFFACLTQNAAFDRKELLRTISAESLKSSIQYVGVRGTVFEQWEDLAG